MSGNVERGRVLHGGGDYANLAVPLGEEAVVPVSGASRGLARNGSPRPRAPPPRDGLRARPRARPRSDGRRNALAPAACAWRLPPSASPAETSTRRSSTTGTTRSVSSPRAFDRMRVQLAQLDNARKEFVANASHELRTPLFSIGGFLELLAGRRARRGDAPRLHRDHAGSGATPREALDRPPRPLACRRRSAEPSRANPSTSDRVVQMLAGEIEHLAVSRASTGCVTAIDDDVWCRGDDARILQIGRALATNAMTHTPAGTTVTLESAAKQESDRTCRRGRRAGDSAEPARRGGKQRSERGNLRDYRE